MNRNWKTSLRLFAIATSCMLAGLTLLTGQETGWGNLKGQIVVEGDLPEIAFEVVDKDTATCLVNDEMPLDDNLLVDAKSRGLKDAFVMMYLKKGTAKPAVHPSYESAKNNPIEIDNKNCRFVPHATFLRTGQTLRLKNSDDVGHNCHIILFNNEINMNLPVSEHVDVNFDKPEKIPGLVKCDMHLWMDGVLLVREEPYVAVTDKDGNFEIKNIPAGEWKFQFWHKKTGYMRDLNVPKKKVGRRGEVELVFEDGKTVELGELKFDAAKFKK